MHIAFFSDQHPATLGGLQVSVGLQRKYLERAGHSVTVCAPASKRTPSREYARDGDVFLRATQVGEHSFCLAGARTDRAIDTAFAGKDRIDVVHVQADVWGAWNGYRFARRHGIPLVHTMHTNLAVGLPALVPFPRIAFEVLFRAQSRFLRAGPIREIRDYVCAFADAADAVIAPSTHYANNLRKYGVEKRIHVVPTGVDDDQLAGLGDVPVSPRPRPVLIWPGRVSQEKWLDDFLTAFARSGADADVHVYGAGNDLARCKLRAAKLGLGSRVAFFGPVSHDTVLHAMRHADAVVQSSLGYETQGLTMYEAVSVGTAVLVRDRNIAADLPAPLRHSVADDSIGAFATAITDLVRQLRDQRGTPPEPTGLFRQSRLTERILATYDEARATYRRQVAVPIRRERHAA